MRTPIELALSVRSYERVVCLADPARGREEYPDHWTVPRTLRDARIDQVSVVVIDRIYVSGKTLWQIAERHPRLVAFGIIDVPHYRECRRLIKEHYPFADIWEHNDVDLAKLLVTNACGAAYDRREVVDMRPPGAIPPKPPMAPPAGSAPAEVVLPRER